jgi:hypothetical protein
MGIKRRRKVHVDPEHRLIGRIQSSSFSYFIADHRSQGYQFADDEAIIDLRASIVKIEPPNADHLGAELECSLVCARRFDEAATKNDADRPFFLSVNLVRKAVESARIVRPK